MIDFTKVRIVNDYVYFETDRTIRTKKKITGHSFVDLSGFNPYTKRGDTILSLVGIRKEEVDKKYLYRGEIAEQLVRNIYEKKLGKKIVWYDEKTKKDNYYDFFPTFLQCGGIPDIEIPSENTLVEVKSKSMKDYEKIKTNGSLVYELYQALYYGYLRNYDKITMFYVFFDEESEKQAFANQPITNFKNIKFLSNVYEVKREEIEFLLKSDLEYYNNAIREKRIHISDFSDKVLKELGASVHNGL